MLGLLLETEVEDEEETEVLFTEAANASPFLSALTADVRVSGGQCTVDPRWIRLKAAGLQTYSRSRYKLYCDRTIQRASALDHDRQR